MCSDSDMNVYKVLCDNPVHTQIFIDIKRMYLSIETTIVSKCIP